MPTLSCFINFDLENITIMVWETRKIKNFILFIISLIIIWSFFYCIYGFVLISTLRLYYHINDNDYFFSIFKLQWRIYASFAVNCERVLVVWADNSQYNRQLIRYRCMEYFVLYVKCVCMCLEICEVGKFTGQM